MKQCFDAIVIGSGIGGATVAKELSRRGEKVLLIEKGGYHRFLGNHLAVVRIADRKGFRYTKEHLLVASGITVGGSSVIAAGTAYRPPKGAFKEWGITLEKELDESEREANVTILPDELIGEGNLNLMRAGTELGYKWQKLPKFVNTENCIENCSACMLGCKRNAKFTARDFIEEGITNGLKLQKANVSQIVIEGNTAIGVKLKRSHIIRANKIVLAAGGVHSPILLQKAGIKEAGSHFFMDPMIFTYSTISKDKRTINDMPMAVGTYEFYEEGLLQSPVVDPWGLFLITMLYQKNPLNILKFRHYPRLVGIMTKIQDDKSGTLKKGRLSLNISKKLTQQDMNRLEKGNNLAKEVLIQAGASSKRFFPSSIRGAHPGGTNSIGEVVDTDLKTKVSNLYVCDASILPKSLGTPLMLVLMAFGKRLARHLLDED
ncbi:MAG: GMC family oxidoreductase N-terminal domain-containing protein [Candidatus Hodarchaeales archaeon]